MKIESCGVCGGDVFNSAEVAALEAENAKLRADVERMRAALEWYASEAVIDDDNRAWNALHPKEA